jgi:N-acetylated-alpha-linked acidic dipeptidase
MGARAASGKVLSLETQRALDESLLKTERAMTLERGLPRRPWFKHQIYAPGFYTGYGVKTLPGVREAIEQKNWQEASSEIEVVARTLDQVSLQIDAAAAKLKGD